MAEKDYIIISDSGCDEPPEELEEKGIPCAEMTYRIGDDPVDYTCRAIPAPEFYARLRDGEVVKTAAVNVAELTALFESYLKQGIDVLFLSMTSGISSSASMAQSVAERLSDQYPERKVVAFDTKCVSGGQSLLVDLAAKKRDEGASFDELLDYVKQTAPRVCHLFTVDDLMFLSRGGRLSTGAAIAGTVLNVKPMLHVDDEGRLAATGKVRGRNRAIKSLVDRYAEIADEETRSMYYINHGDCADEAAKIEEAVFALTGTRAGRIDFVTPVVGAHSGPGTLSLFFLSDER